MSARPVPLVSILIPAYNAEAWIADTIRSALAQTWTRKEIIVVDDGSRDRTLAIATEFAGAGVSVVAERHQGAAGTRNRGFALSRGDYIQWLDADDLLVPDKIERQLSALGGDHQPRTLLSSRWGRFAYRPEQAKFVPSALWQDLKPVEWLLRKMGQNLFMQTGAWLTSRELALAAGPWDVRLLTDDDGEYFCRVLLACESVRFVPEGGVLYRDIHSQGVSFVGASDEKMDAMLISAKLHIKYLMSLENSPRTRAACLAYLKGCRNVIHPKRRDILDELRALALQAGGSLGRPSLRWKFTWMRPIIGHRAAWYMQTYLPHYKGRIWSAWDGLMRDWQTASGPVHADRNGAAVMAVGATGDAAFAKASIGTLPGDPSPKLSALAHRLLPRLFHPALHRVRGSPLASRLVRGSFWSLVGSLTSRVLALGAAIIAARILGKAAYGELGIVQSTLSMFGTLAGFGLGTTAMKFVAEHRIKDPAKAGRIIALSSIVSWGTSIALALALYAAAPWLATTALAAPQLTESLQLSSLLLFLNGINGAQNGVLSGFEAFKSIAKVSLVSGLLNFPLVIAGAWYFKLDGLIWGLILAQAVGCLMNMVLVRREAARHRVPIRFDAWRRESGVIWRFSFPTVLGGLLTGPVLWACSALLAHEPDGYIHLGAYNAASQWINALMWLPWMMSGVTLPMLAERFGAEDSDSTAKLLRVAIQINAVCVLPLVALGSLFSPVVMGLYGEDFRGDWPTLIASLATAGVMAIQQPLVVIITASGRVWSGLLLNLIWGVVFLAATWVLLLLDWGSLGLASGQLLASVAQGLCAFLYVGIAIPTLRRA